MLPFNEIYSKYYTLVMHLLQDAHEKPLTLDTLRTYITENGFLETPTTLISALTSQEADSYHLFLKKENTYASILNQAPQTVLSTLEVRWLKSLLDDPKLALFLEDAEIYTLKKALLSIEPLYTQEMIAFTRQNVHDSLYHTPSYRMLFKALMMAIQENQLLEITYTLSAQFPQSIIPYKLEYSIAEDTFNLLGISIKDGVLLTLERISLSTINNVNPIGVAPSREVLDAFAKSCKCKEPITFELYNMRSGFERVFMYLSAYERITQFNEEEDTCLVQLYYYPFDEAKLMDMLISFGPIIKILAPTPIRHCFKARINAQAKLFANFFT